MNVTEFIKKILNELCEKYKLPKLNISFTKEQPPKHLAAAYDYRINTVNIYPEFFNYDLETQKVILYHEFRHHWQFHNYYDVFMLWMNKHGLSVLNQLYHEPFITIEEDARIFGNSLGKYDGEILLQYYTEEKLKYCFEYGFTYQDNIIALSLLKQNQLKYRKLNK